MLRYIIVTCLSASLILCGGCIQSTVQPAIPDNSPVVSISPEPTPQEYVDDTAPYLIKYQERLYVNWGNEITLNSTKNLIELGQIESTAPSNREPQENFQSNIGLVGHTLWCDGEQLLLESELPDVYLIFEPYK